MVLLILLIIILSFFEIREMLKKNQKKEMVVFIGLAIITLTIGGIYYLSKPFEISIARLMFNILGVKW